MKIKTFENFVDKSNAATRFEGADMSDMMRLELKQLLIEFSNDYWEVPGDQLEIRNCTESIMNLIHATKYEW